MGAVDDQQDDRGRDGDVDLGTAERDLKPGARKQRDSHPRTEGILLAMPVAEPCGEAAGNAEQDDEGDGVGEQFSVCLAGKRVRFVTSITQDRAATAWEVEFPEAHLPSEWGLWRETIVSMRTMGRAR